MEAWKWNCSIPKGELTKLMVWHDCHCSNMKKKWISTLRSQEMTKLTLKKRIFIGSMAFDVNICLKMEDSPSTGKENSYNPRTTLKKNPRLFPNPSSHRRVRNGFFLLSPQTLGKRSKPYPASKLRKMGLFRACRQPKLPNSVTRRMTHWKLKTTIK